MDLLSVAIGSFFVAVLLTAGIMTSTYAGRVNEWEKAKPAVGISVAAFFLAAMVSFATVKGLMIEESLDLKEFSGEIAGTILGVCR